MKKSSDYYCENVNHCIIMPQNNDAFTLAEYENYHIIVFFVFSLWLLMLIGISALAVLYRLMFLLPVIRNIRLKLHLISEDVAKFSLRKLKKRFSIGNWQLFLQLTGNNEIDAWELTKIVKWLSEKCEDLEKNNKRM